MIRRRLEIIHRKVPTRRQLLRLTTTTTASWLTTASRGVLQSHLTSDSLKSQSPSQFSALLKLITSKIQNFEKRQLPGELVDSVFRLLKVEKKKTRAKQFFFVFIDLMTFSKQVAQIHNVDADIYQVFYAHTNQAINFFDDILIFLPDKSNSNMSSITRIWDARKRISKIIVLKLFGFLFVPWKKGFACRSTLHVVNKLIFIFLSTSLSNYHLNLSFSRQNERGSVWVSIAYKLRMSVWLMNSRADVFFSYLYFAVLES